MQKIAIHSAPRSGSTWLGNIFNSHPDVAFRYQPLFSYAFKDYLSTTSSSEEIQTFFDLIEKSNDPFMNQIEGVEKGIIPSFRKSKMATHVCYKEVRYHNILENMLLASPQLKAILLIRNPLAVLYSWKNAPKEFRNEEGWNFEDEWKDAPLKNQGKSEEFNGYKKWKEATQLFLNLQMRFPNQVYLLDYQELLLDTVNVVKDVFKFSNLTVSKQTLSFLEKSSATHQKDAYSIFKIKPEDDQWKNLPSEIIDYVKADLKGSKLEKFLHD